MRLVAFRKRLFFGYLQKGDKPYNAICELRKPEKKDVLTELASIANGNLSDHYEREVGSLDAYRSFGLGYCEVNKIDTVDKWDFGLEE